MGHALKNRQPATLFRMAPKAPRTSWHYDWRGKLVLNALRVGIGLSALVTAGSIAYLVAHHIR
jgi:hypothetical protein